MPVICQKPKIGWHAPHTRAKLSVAEHGKGALGRKCARVIDRDHRICSFANSENGSRKDGQSARAHFFFFFFETPKKKTKTEDGKINKKPRKARRKKKKKNDFLNFFVRSRLFSFWISPLPFFMHTTESLTGLL
jgi:hypothetical protein